jgi:hypothetical protein
MRAIFQKHLHKVKKYYDEAERITAAYLSQVPEKFASERIAQIAASEDVNWRQAVADEQFAERLANVYGQAAVLEELERLRKEQQNTNLLLCALFMHDIGAEDGGYMRSLIQTYRESIR